MKYSPKVFTLAATVTIAGFIVARASAAVLVTTSGSGANGNIVISMPAINFNIIKYCGGGTLVLVFDEAQPNAGFNQSANFTGPLLGGGQVTFYGDSGYNAFDMTGSDPFILTYNADIFAPGDTANYAWGDVLMYAADSSVDIFPSGYHEVFLTDQWGERVSQNGIAIPEPSSILLLVLGGLACATRRREARKAEQSAAGDGDKIAN